MTINPFHLSWGQQVTFWIGVQSGSHGGIAQPVVGFYYGIGGPHLEHHGWAQLVSDNGTRTYEGGNVFNPNGNDFRNALATQDASNHDGSNGHTVQVRMLIESHKNPNGGWDIKMRINSGDHHIERTATVDFAPTTAMIYAEKKEPSVSLDATANIAVNATVRVLTLEFGAEPTGETVLLNAGAPFTVGTVYQLT